MGPKERAVHGHLVLRCMRVLVPDSRRSELPISVKAAQLPTMLISDTLAGISQFVREFSVKKRMCGAAVAALTILSAVSLAPGAQATTGVDCSASGTTVSVTVTVGTVNSFSPLTSCAFVYARDNLHGFAPTVGAVTYTDGSGVHALSGGADAQNLVGLSDVTYTAPLVPGHDGIRLERSAGSGVNLEITVVAAPVTALGGAAPVFQALPMPSSGKCADIKDSAYAWGTGLTGGWQKSWQPWAGTPDSNGGWACARTFVMLNGVTWSIAN